MKHHTRELHLDKVQEKKDKENEESEFQNIKKMLEGIQVKHQEISLCQHYTRLGPHDDKWEDRINYLKDELRKGEKELEESLKMKFKFI